MICASQSSGTLSLTKRTESAMRNSDLLISRELGEKMSTLAEGPATFHNLNVVEDRTW